MVVVRNSSFAWRAEREKKFKSRVESVRPKKIFQSIPGDCCSCESVGQMAILEKSVSFESIPEVTIERRSWYKIYVGAIAPASVRFAKCCTSSPFNKYP